MRETSWPLSFSLYLFIYIYVFLYLPIYYSLSLYLYLYNSTTVSVFLSLPIIHLYIPLLLEFICYDICEDCLLNENLFLFTVKLLIELAKTFHPARKLWKGRREGGRMRDR